MEFDWDDRKNAINIGKHGVEFDFAKRIFEGPVVTRLDGRTDYGESRYVSIGMIDDLAILAVTHTDRDGRTRIISARPASRQERRLYHDQV